MIKIYHAPATRGIRVIWLCEELGLAYEVVPVDFSPEYRATPEWRALNPVGKVPVMTDGDTTMFESGAMVQYLLERYAKGQLQPRTNSAEYAHYLQWLWFGEATMARPLGEIVNHGREFPGGQRIPAVVAEMAARSVDCMRAVADHVAERQYLLGDEFTAADIMVGYSLNLAHMLIPDQVPASIAPYWGRLQARKAFQVAVSK